MSEHKEIILKEDGYSINLYWAPDKNGSFYHVDFKVHVIFQWSKSDGVGGIAYHDELGKCGTDTAPLEKALPFIDGSIKWGGCINYKYPGQEHCMLHKCGVHDFKNEFNIFKTLYSETSKIMKNADFTIEEINKGE